MDEYSSQKSGGMSQEYEPTLHRDTRERITHLRTPPAVATTSAKSTATTSKLEEIKTSRDLATTKSTLTTTTTSTNLTTSKLKTTTTSKLTTNGRVAGRNAADHLESQHASLDNAFPSMVPSPTPQMPSLSPQPGSSSSSSSSHPSISSPPFRPSALPSSSSSSSPTSPSTQPPSSFPLRSSRLSTLYHDRNHRRCRVSPIVARPSLPVREQRTRTELDDGKCYDGGGGSSSSDGCGGHSSSGVHCNSANDFSNANLNNSNDVRKKKNNTVAKNNKSTFGGKTKGEGFSAAAVFHQESKFHMKDGGTDYFSVFNAASNYASETVGDFDDSDKEDGDNGDNEKDDGTLIMAFDKEGNEVWVPKTMLEELGPSATLLPTDEMPGKTKGCCGFFHGQTRKKYVSSMLAVQVIVNIIGFIGLVLVFVFYH